MNHSISKEVGCMHMNHPTALDVLLDQANESLSANSHAIATWGFPAFTTIRRDTRSRSGGWKRMPRRPIRLHWPTG